MFRGDYLRAVETIGEKISAQVFFANHNDVLDLWIPETFLLVLNQPVLAELISRYRVGACQIYWHDLVPAAQERLATLGIGPDQLPENYKPTFDTLRALLMLAIADGYPLEFITRHSVEKAVADDVFHVGSSSDPRQNLRLARDYQLWGTYFWIRRLELFEDSELRERYLAQFGFGSSAEVLSRFQAKPQEDVLAFVDKLAAAKASDALQLAEPGKI